MAFGCSGPEFSAAAAAGDGEQQLYVWPVPAAPTTAEGLAHEHGGSAQTTTQSAATTTTAAAAGDDGQQQTGTSATLQSARWSAAWR